MSIRAGIAFVCALVLAGAAHAAPQADVAALQVVLLGRGLYPGPVDGQPGPATDAAVRAFQARAGLAVDGVAGPATRRALGNRWRHDLGSRRLGRGDAGWDVAALQFLLAVHGFPSGPFDGKFGLRVERAVERFQRSVRLRPDGVAGPATLVVLGGPPPRAPFPLLRPVPGPLGDRFGPRGAGFHVGVDFVEDAGVAVAAAGSGRVVFAGWREGGFGYTVVLAHGHGVRTLYAHLSSIEVGLGDRVRAGFRIGRVGSSGRSSGPHLHFEARVRGAAVDPLAALG